jgi:hypothetical protein
MTPKYDITVQLSGQDGNIFNLVSIVSNAIKREGATKQERDELLKEVTSSGSYDEALRVLMGWVNVQ